MLTQLSECGQLVVIAERAISAFLSFHSNNNAKRLYSLLVIFHIISSQIPAGIYSTLFPPNWKNKRYLLLLLLSFSFFLSLGSKKGNQNII